MAAYAYRCPAHGEFGIVHPIGTAPARSACPECGTDAPRVYTAPHLSLGSPARRALIENTERTAELPDVVAAPPPRPGRRPVATNPKLARLPRL